MVDVVIGIVASLAAVAGKAGQSVPNGFCNVNKMLGNVVRRNGRFLVF